MEGAVISVDYENLVYSPPLLQDKCLLFITTEFHRIFLRKCEAIPKPRKKSSYRYKRMVEDNFSSFRNWYEVTIPSHFHQKIYDKISLMCESPFILCNCKMLVRTSILYCFVTKYVAHLEWNEDYPVDLFTKSLALVKSITISFIKVSPKKVMKIYSACKALERLVIYIDDFDHSYLKCLWGELNSTELKSVGLNLQPHGCPALKVLELNIFSSGLYEDEDKGVQLGVDILTNLHELQILNHSHIPLIDVIVRLGEINENLSNKPTYKLTHFYCTMFSSKDISKIKPVFKNYIEMFPNIKHVILYDIIEATYEGNKLILETFSNCMQSLKLGTDIDDWENLKIFSVPFCNCTFLDFSVCFTLKSILPLLDQYFPNLQSLKFRSRGPINKDYYVVNIPTLNKIYCAYYCSSNDYQISVNYISDLFPHANSISIELNVHDDDTYAVTHYKRDDNLWCIVDRESFFSRIVFSLAYFA